MSVRARVRVMVRVRVRVRVRASDQCGAFLRLHARHRVPARGDELTQPVDLGWWW